MVASRQQSTDTQSFTNPVQGRPAAVQRSSAAGVLSSVQFRGMGYDAQSAYLSPSARAQPVQRSEDGATSAGASQDSGGAAFGVGEVEEQKATVVGESPTISQDGVVAAIQGALPKFQERLKSEFKCTAKLSIGADGKATAVDLPVCPAATAGEIGWVIDVLRELQYPKPQPEGSSVVITVPLTIPAAKQ